ncbi:MAG: hypothetical protein ACE5I2_09825 [Anaerolineae bacterium]
MRLYNRYLATLALLFMGTTVILAAYNLHRLDLYFSLYLMEYLATTLLFAYLQPRAQRLLNFTGYILFGGFLVIVGLKVWEILVGVP